MLSKFLTSFDHTAAGIACGGCVKDVNKKCRRSDNLQDGVEVLRLFNIGNAGFQHGGRDGVIRVHVRELQSRTITQSNDAKCTGGFKHHALECTLFARANVKTE